MYVPDHFVLTDRDAILEVMAANPLAVLASNGPDAPVVTHLPLIAKEEGGEIVLYGHFARANPHWKGLGDRPALAIFTGPEGYISPGWYATKRETGKVVPTWNYVTVHARGIPRLLDPGADTRMAVDLLTDAMEATREMPWKLDDAPARYTDAMLRGIVAFRMVAASIDAAAKLSQNKSNADFSGARNGLVAEGAVALSDAMATTGRMDRG